MRHTRARRLTAAVTGLVTAAALALAAATPAAQAAQPVGGQVVANGGLEGLWEANESGAATISTERAHGGTHSIEATDRSTTGSGPMQRLGGRMSAGTTYTLSYWIYYD